MNDWIIELVNTTGYWGVAVLMFLETVFPPVPSEVIMTVAGISAARGNMAIEGVIGAGTAGAMLGNWLWFMLARKVGELRLRTFVTRFGRWLTLDWDEIERGERLFERHGNIIIMIARMLPTFRSLISIPAGLFRMGQVQFLLFSAIGSAALAGAGYFLGSQFQDVERVVGPLATAIIVLIVLGYFWRLWRWRARG
jgi:membrane protein DedA with SNARE-associated domain